MKDKDVLSTTALPEVEGDEEELKEGWDAISVIYYHVMSTRRLPAMGLYPPNPQVAFSQPQSEPIPL